MVRCVLWLVSFGLPYLNNIQIGGFKLGFWFAQQGSIYIFVILIFVYVYLMNKLDIRFGVQETEERVMSVQIWTYIFVGITFSLYIGIAIWSKASEVPRNSMWLKEL